MINSEDIYEAIIIGNKLNIYYGLKNATYDNFKKILKKLTQRES